LNVFSILKNLGSKKHEFRQRIAGIRPCIGQPSYYSLFLLATIYCRHDCAKRLYGFHAGTNGLEYQYILNIFKKYLTYNFDIPHIRSNDLSKISSDDLSMRSSAKGDKQIDYKAGRCLVEWEAQG
jgi:hypothetical protein